LEEQDGVMTLPVVDRNVFRRYAGLSLPRHVAYPMPSWWRQLAAGEGAAVCDRALAAHPTRELSLYCHIPYCESLCKFCACNRVIMRKKASQAPQRVNAFLQALEDELRAASPRAAGRVVKQLHFGGGTPTYLDEAQLEHLFRVLADHYPIAADAELSIEIDPRVTSREQLQLLASLGFNRVSLGVQDFDPVVQEHVNRVQPYEMVESCVTDARQAGFGSVNFDLIYGLPFQTRESLRQTIEATIQLGPDRIAFYHYAQIPEKIATQRAIDHRALPDSETKLDMFLEARVLLQDAGYQFIGLDHFARPQEPLARAARDGTINRNFQGMTTGADLDLLGFGPSGTSVFPGVAYVQNHHDPQDYAQAVSRGDPWTRGLELSPEDALRQWLLLRLYCDAGIDARQVEQRWELDFRDSFATELKRLEVLEADGLVELSPDGSFRLTDPLGRVLMRNVGAVFDAYLDDDAYQSGQPVAAFSSNA